MLSRRRDAPFGFYNAAIDLITARAYIRAYAKSAFEKKNRVTSSVLHARSCLCKTEDVAPFLGVI